jgi:uncharacterized membrane protein YkvA (DUF1232 family)
LVLTDAGFNFGADLEGPAWRGTQYLVAINAESQFVELVRSWLVSLPHDLKTAFDAMDDENLPRPARELATGVAIYIVSPKDSTQDRADAVSYADDAVLLRVVFQKAFGPGEDEDAFRARYPELFDSLDADLTLCKSVMGGELMTWLESKIGSLKTVSYKGKKLAKYLDDDEARGELFDDGLVFRTNYPVDEDRIGDKLKKATTIIDSLKRTRSEEARAKGKSA